MAQNMFIKFEEPGIEGEVTATDHAKEIEILSWSHSFNQPTSPTRSSAGGGTVEKANHSDFTFTKYHRLLDRRSAEDVLERQADRQGDDLAPTAPTATTRRSSISRSPWTR